MCVCVEGEIERLIHFNKLVHVILEAGKSEVCRVDWLGKSPLPLEHQ